MGFRTPTLAVWAALEATVAVARSGGDGVRRRPAAARAFSEPVGERRCINDDVVPMTSCQILKFTIYSESLGNWLHQFSVPQRPRACVDTKSFDGVVSSLPEPHIAR